MYLSGLLYHQTRLFERWNIRDDSALNALDDRLFFSIDLVTNIILLKS
jgi:hypothetical protein